MLSCPRKAATRWGALFTASWNVPAVGDTIEFGGINIEVLTVAGRRIKQVRARLAEEPTARPTFSHKTASHPAPKWTIARSTPTASTNPSIVEGKNADRDRNRGDGDRRDGCPRAGLRARTPDFRRPGPPSVPRMAPSSPAVTSRMRPTV